MTPEEHLYQAVILQAVRDAGMERDSANTRSSYANRTRAEAQEFLTAQVGEWSKARETISWVVGYDPAWLRNKAMEFLASGVKLGPRELSRYRAKVEE